MNTDFIEIIRYASKAPSGHNTQPWKFRMDRDTITVIPDLKVALPVVDGENRELFISLGCAAENLCIAASHFSYGTHIAEQGKNGISIHLSKNPTAASNPLLRQIEKRQTNRSVYNGNKIPEKVLSLLQSIHKEDSIGLYFTETGTPFANTIVEYIRKGNAIQMSDKAFREELLSWMRFNPKQIEATCNGLSYRVFGNPPLPGLLAKPIVRLFLKPDIQNKSEKKKIDASSHFVVYTTRHNTVEEWIDLGRTLQRFLLQATECGIAYAFLNQPCEVASLAADLQNTLPVNQEYPTLIIRIGYAESVPYSPRKAVESLLI